MKGNPRVSIISPLYNVSDYVSECVGSLLAQTSGDFEAIFVDDGSDDGSLEAAKRAAKDDDRFVFLEGSHGGQSVARNRALARARGEYVMFLDSDDAYAPETVETVLAALEGGGLDAFFFTARMHYDEHSLVRTNFESFMERVPSDGVLDGFQMMVHFCTTDSFRPSACMFALKRKIIEEVGMRFHPGIIHEDLLFTMKVFPYLKRCRFDLAPLYIRRMRQGSTMTKPRSLKNVDGLFTVTRELESFLREHADEWPTDYLDAYCSEVHRTWELLQRDVELLGVGPIGSYRSGLSPRDRADFDLHVYEPARRLKAVRDEYEGSTTYRAGRLLMAAPTWLKDHLAPAPE